jgi:hypothetical protein
LSASVGQLELALLRAYLHTFERRFCKAVGPRYVELDEALAHAARLRERFMPSAHRESLAARERARQSADECARALQPRPSDPERVKQLQRELARTFHPDLETDGMRRIVREKLMTEVNLAYKENDLARLELLAGALDHDENGDAAHQLAELANSPLNELRERVDYARRQQKDLLSVLSVYVMGACEEARTQGAHSG